MSEEIERKGRSGADSISNDVVAGETKTVDIVKEETIKNEVIEEKEEVKKEIEEVKPENQNININVDKKGKKPKKEKKNRNTRTTLLVLSVLLIIVVAIGLLYLKIQDLKDKYAIPKEFESVFDETIERKESDETNLLVEFGDKYNVNDILITSYYDYDGNVSTEGRSTNGVKVIRDYVQISGLKNKEVQDSINNTIKNYVYNISVGQDGKLAVYTFQEGNFGNILSILVSAYKDNANYPTYTGLNFDLNTGDIIQFEDVFINSTPVAALLTDAAMKAKAWQVDLDYDSMTDEEYFRRRGELYDMNNRDFSNAEDYGVEVAKLYKERKGKINFVVTPKATIVYDFDTSFLNDGYRPLVIYFNNNSGYVAAYKRFNYGTSLYENDINPNDVYVFTSLYSGYYGNYFENKDNIYINMYLNGSNENNKQMLNSELTNRVFNDIKVKANANPNKRYVITGYAGISDVSYKKEYNYNHLMYMDKFLTEKGINKSIDFNYTLEVMDNMDNNKFGEIMATLDALPTASAEAYPVSTLTDPYRADEYAYLHIPEIETNRVSDSYYYSDYVLTMTKKDIPEENELIDFYYKHNSEYSWFFQRHGYEIKYKEGVYDSDPNYYDYYTINNERIRIEEYGEYYPES